MIDYDELFTDATDPLQKAQDVPEHLMGRINAKELLETPVQDRNDRWLKQFNDSLGSSPIAPRKPPVFSGPDGFRYVSVDLVDESDPGRKTTISRITPKALEKGLGVAVNVSRNAVDWVLSYGDLFTLHHFGTLNIPQLPRLAQPTVDIPKEKTKIGPPSEKRLPAYVRAILKRYMQKRLNITNPGVLVIVRDDKTQSENLVFNVFPEDYTDAEQFQKVLIQLSWFLPRHYHILAVKKGAGLESKFTPL